MIEPRRAFIYARVSDPSKADRVDPSASIPRQREELGRMVQDDGCLVLQVFEEGMSAHALGRPVFDEMMARLGEVDAVYVVAYDRLTRIPEPAEQELIRKAFVAAGVDIVTPGMLWRYSDPDFDTPETRLSNRVQGLFAAHEWETITRRLKKGKLKNIQLGEYYGHGVPYGYEQSFDPATGEKVFTVNEDQAAVVREMFRAYEGGMGTGGIARMLNARGIPSPKGVTWSQAQCRKMIHQALYTGLSEYNKPICKPVHKGPRIIVESLAFPAIIEREQWERVQALVPLRKHHGNRGPQGKQRPLSGILRCPECERPMIMTNNNSQRGSYYACRGLRKEVHCPSPQMLNALEAQRVVMAWIRKELPKALAGSAKAHAKEAKKTNGDQQTEMATAARRRVSELKRKFDGVVELAALKVLAPEEAAAQLDAIREDQAKARAHLEALEGQLSRATVTAAVVSSWLEVVARLERVPHDAPGVREVFASVLRSVTLTKTHKVGRNWQLAVERVTLADGITLP